MDEKTNQISAARACAAVPNRRRRIVVTAGLVGAALIVAAVWYVRIDRRPPPPEPPAIDLTGADPEVAHAVQEAQEAVRKSPRSAQTWGRLGMILAVHDFHRAAIVALAEAERLDPHEPHWPYYQARSLELHDPEQAIAKLRRCVELALAAGSPNRAANAAAELRLAKLLLARGQLDEAEKWFRQVEQDDPEDGRAPLGLAQVARARGDRALCLDHLKRAAERRGARKAAHALAAELYAQVPGQESEAAREQQIAARLPEDPAGTEPYSQEATHFRVGKQARVEHAHYLRSVGQPREALGLLQETIRLYPDFDLAWLAFGEGLLDAHDLRAAEHALRQATRLGPSRSEAHFALGMALYQQREHRPEALTEAAEAFRQAIRRFPTESRAHLALGACLKEQGDWREALSEYQASLHCRPDYAAAHRRLGELLTDLGRGIDAAACLQHLAGCPLVIDLALPIRLEALTHLRYAAQLDPEDPTTREALNRLIGEFPNSRP